MTTTVGLVGYGNWAREAYVPALLDDAAAEIGAVAARTEETRRLASESFGAGSCPLRRPLPARPGVRRGCRDDRPAV